MRIVRSCYFSAKDSTLVSFLPKTANNFEVFECFIECAKALAISPLAITPHLSFLFPVKFFPFDMTYILN